MDPRTVFKMVSMLRDRHGSKWRAYSFPLHRFFGKYSASARCVGWDKRVVSLGQSWATQQDPVSKTHTRQPFLPHLSSPFFLLCIMKSCRHVVSPETRTIFAIQQFKSSPVTAENQTEQSYLISTQTTIFSITLKPAKCQWNRMIQLIYKMSRTILHRDPELSSKGNFGFIQQGSASKVSEVWPSTTVPGCNTADSTGPLMLQAHGALCIRQVAFEKSRCCGLVLLLSTV